MLVWCLLLLAAQSVAGWGAPVAARPRAAHAVHGASAPARAPRVAVSMAPVVVGKPAQQARLYSSPEPPKVAGGLKVGQRKLVVLTGASSGLGLSTLKALQKKKGYFVVCAVRDVAKMQRVVKEEGLDAGALTIMKLELGNLKSVRDFVQNLRAFKLTRPLDYLICNAAVYLPKDPQARFTDDGIEQSLGINHVGHFLLARLLIDDLKAASDPRCVIVGSITGNTNTIGGGLVYPRADLGDLEGLRSAAAGQKYVEMADGKGFFGAKAYKDSKVCNMMTMYELHARYHASTGINFASMYPGCIADTPLFREKRQWFRTLFPLFMKYVTGGYVSEEEAGERLAQCVTDPACKKSGIYWSWNGNAQQVGVKKNFWDPPSGAGGSGGEIFENQVSDEVRNREKSRLMWEYTSKLVGLQP
ncbi:hypothetical protein KFE25_009928 [Diacronema lutheri]|uniref:protochlorophyllide reductase n=1 Tax=Diacronema lutheri TaxID=2081491 RepID=A0A8J5XSD3_DIALT|nr:hypothetical protein KFE25_009928 [Diacronema lutheri]